MHGINGAARLGFAAALLALLLAPFALSAGTASAQGPDVAQYYGTGLEAGDVVAAMVGDNECATTTVDASGNWVLRVNKTCPAQDGDTVSFTLNGAMAEQTESWKAGGTPSDPAGIMLTVADDADAGDGMATPDDKGDTGNAGLAASAGSASAAAVAALALLALTLTAAARRATTRA